MSSAGAGDWTINRQGVEAPWPLTFVQKYTQKHDNYQKNPRDGASHREGESGALGKGGHREHDANPSGPVGTALLVEAVSRGGRREGGGGRQSE